jgi:hypothetical protein
VQPDNLRSNLLYFLKTYKAYITATVLSILSAWFFLVIGYPNLFAKLPFFTQRWFGLGILTACLVTTYLACYYSNWKLTKFWSVFVQSNLITLFSFAYYLRLNNSILGVGNVIISTSLVFIPLTALIFLVNLNLFGSKESKIYLILPQVLVITLYTFSFLSFINLDRTDVRDFSQDWLLFLFNLPLIFWLVLGSVAIALVSTLNSNVGFDRRKIGLVVLFGFLIFQALCLIYSLRFTYWYQTLLLIVVWDFLFHPFKLIMNQVKDPKFRPKMVVSSFYHAFLFFIVMIFG